MGILSWLNPLNWFWWIPNLFTNTSSPDRSFDDVLCGMVQAIDELHSATVEHIAHLETFLKNNCPKSSYTVGTDIEISKVTLRYKEWHLIQSKSEFMKEMHSVQQTQPGALDNWPKTCKYIKDQEIDDENTSECTYEESEESEVSDHHENHDDIKTTLDLSGDGTSLDALLESSKVILEIRERLNNLENSLDIKKLQERTREVQVYCQSDSSFLDDTVELLEEQLNASIDKKVHFTRVTNPESALSEVPLLILRVHSSRLGTDGLNAIKGVNNPENTALVIVHYKEEHALSETSSSQILVGSEFENIGGIVDLAYVKDKGVYSCKMNTMTKTALRKFISK